MASPRQLGRGLFARLVARVLIAVLLFSLVPLQAQASIPKSALPDPRPTEDLAAATKPARLLVVVVVGEPIWLTKSAFGELLGHSGIDPQPYAFAGEPLEPNSGFQYHRARWIDPRLGRFAEVDPYPSVPVDPSTLHRYLYVRADPVNRVDPSGLLFSNLVWGRKVHELLGQHFLSTVPSAPLWVDTAISTILGFTVQDYGRLRPDLVDGGREEVYEIKPFGADQYLLGVAQLTFYIATLRAADPRQRNWKVGSNYAPPTTLHIDFGSWLL